MLLGIRDKIGRKQQILSRIEIVKLQLRGKTLCWTGILPVLRLCTEIDKNQSNIIRYMSDRKPENKQNNKQDFLFPRHTYRGDFTPEKLVFNANLQEFAQQVNIICSLETSGKISTEDAYKKIKALWKQLKRSKQELGIGKRSEGAG